MPIIKRAIKKMRQDERRRRHNAHIRLRLHAAIKNARKTPTAKTISAAYTLLDKSAKTHVIHRNKAARLKSRLARLA